MEVMQIIMLLLLLLFTHNSFEWSLDDENKIHNTTTWAFANSSKHENIMFWYQDLKAYNFGIQKIICNVM